MVDAKEYDQKNKYEAKICLFDGDDFWNFHGSQTKTTMDRLFMKKLWNLNCTMICINIKAENKLRLITKQLLIERGMALKVW